MNDTVRPLLWAGAAATTAVHGRVEAALARALAGWMTEPIAIDAAPLVQADDRAFGSCSSAAGSLWWRVDKAVWAQALFGGDSTTYADDPWVGAATDEAVEAARRSVTFALLGEEASPTAAAPLPGSAVATGAGCIQVRCRRLGLHVVVEGRLWQDWIPDIAAAKRSPLTPLADALGPVAASLEVVLGDVEIDAATLTDLRHGDVLRLRRRTDERALVRFGGAPIAYALLGERAGRQHIRLSSQERS
jgi:hypothetical protein